MTDIAAVRFSICLCLTIALLASGLKAFAENAPVRGTHVILLGTAAGPIPRKTRSQPASLLVVEDHAYLIDAGDGVVRQLRLADYQPAQIDAVFLTHLHLDHTGGLSAFLTFEWMGQPAGPVPIYGPPGTEMLVHAAIQYSSISTSILETEGPLPLAFDKTFQPHDVEVAAKPAEIYSDDKVRVSAVENTHYITTNFPKRPYGVDKSYSYRFDTPDRSVVITGDTGPSDAVVELAKNADVLVSEVIDVPSTIATARARARRVQNVSKDTWSHLVEHMKREHLTPEEVGKIAVKARVKMVVLTHIAAGTEDEAIPNRLAATVRTVYSGPVIAGKDLDEY